MFNKNKKAEDTVVEDTVVEDSKTEHKPEQECCQGAPIEHYRGESACKHLGDRGDLEEETLDPDAPYNKTYGLKK